MSGKNTGSSGPGIPESDADDKAGKARGQDHDGGGHARRRLEEMISQRMPVEPVTEAEEEEPSAAEDPSHSNEHDAKEEAPGEE